MFTGSTHPIGVALGCFLALLIQSVIALYLIRLASFDFVFPPFPLPLPSLFSSSFPNLPLSRWVRPVAHRRCVPALQYRLIVELAYFVVGP